jgi:hypothetical protein
MKYVGTTIFAVALGALIFVLVRGDAKEGAEQTRALDAAHAGGDYLVNHFNQDTGAYDYRYDAATDEVLSGYNLLRHAGTTYALLELYRDSGTRAYIETAHTALRWLDVQKDPCPPPHEKLACLYEGEETKLGGSGLAILALVEAYRATDDTRYLAVAEELAAWPLAMQTAQGEYPLHIQTKDGTVRDHVSLYYPGEVIFGLARLGEATGNSAYIDSAEKAARWVITVRDADVPVEKLEHDHWLLYGLNEIDRVAPDEMYLDHTQKLVRAIAGAQHVDPARVPDPLWVGGFYEPPRGTPTATRVEGLASAYALALRHGDAETAERARQTVARAVPFILETHIDKADAQQYPNPDRATGGFTGTLTDSEVRIDYVQHSISALLHAFPLLEE